MKILLAVDGSDYSVKATEFLATHLGWFQGAPQLRLLHVKLPIPEGLAVGVSEEFLDRDTVNVYYKEQAEAALAPSEDTLRKHNIPFVSNYKVGDIAREITAYASKEDIDMIVMGSHGHGAFRNMVMGSVATKLLATTKIPVLIVR